MRKCVFRKFVRNNTFALGFSGTKTVPVYEDSEPGYFHQWGNLFEEFEAGPGNCTVAIVEMPDGSIQTPAAMLVRFLDTPPVE